MGDIWRFIKQIQWNHLILWWPILVEYTFFVYKLGCSFGFQFKYKKTTFVFVENVNLWGFATHKYQKIWVTGFFLSGTLVRKSIKERKSVGSIPKIVCPKLLFGTLFDGFFKYRKYTSLPKKYNWYDVWLKHDTYFLFNQKISQQRKKNLRFFSV